jgi:Na+-transporting NADH:ubiquinone oxidoreductase subunit NqrD
MEKPAQAIEGLYEKIETYTVSSYELSKLRTLETTTLVASAVVSRLVVIIVFGLFALFVNIGIAIYLGDLLGRYYVGFLIVSVFYLVIGIVLHFFLYRWIKKPLSDFIITQVLQ